MSPLSAPTDALRPVAPAASTHPAAVRVLGCSGAISRDCRTTAFLLDDDVLIDAGTGVGDLGLEELARIDHILLSHSHLDHVLGVPLLADAVLRNRRGRAPIRVYGLPHTLQALREHLFNQVLWPDFTRLPSPEHPVLTLCELQVGQTLAVGRHQRQVRVLPAVHGVPAVGFAVISSQGAWVYTGDTGSNPALWPALADLRVRQLVVEVAFSEAERAMALSSRHHCPSTLAAELHHLPDDAHLLVTHVKPGELPAVLAELAERLAPGRRVQALVAGQRLMLP